MPQRKSKSPADGVADPLRLASTQPIAVKKPARRRKRAEDHLADDHSWLAVEVIYDAPRTAAYDAMWRDLIEQALDWLDAKAKAA